jgi:hypothetical protein
MSVWDGLSWTRVGQFHNTAAAIRGLTVGNLFGSEELIAVGAFEGVDGLRSPNIVRWDGSNWLGYFEGNDTSYYVRALTFADDGSGPAIYAGGGFTFAGSAHSPLVARFDGTAWNSVASGVLPPSWEYVISMIGYTDGAGPSVVAAGTFVSMSGIPAARIAELRFGNWSPLGSGIANGGVTALGVFDGGLGPSLYAGGVFSAAGGGPCLNIARWDGMAWHSVGAGIGTPGNSDIIYSLATFDDGTGSALYAGGSFNSASGQPAANIARWNGNSWSPVASGLPSTVSDMEIFDDGSGPALWAGLAHYSPGASIVWRWDGIAWTNRSTGLPAGKVYSMEVFDDGTGPALYLVLGTPPGLLMRWNGMQWVDAAPGVLGMGFALKSSAGPTGPELWVGGSGFAGIANGPLLSIARRRPQGPGY